MRLKQETSFFSLVHCHIFLFQVPWLEVNAHVIQVDTAAIISSDGLAPQNLKQSGISDKVGGKASKNSLDFESTVVGCIYSFQFRVFISRRPVATQDHRTQSVRFAIYS